MARWTIAHIDWDKFDKLKVNPDLLIMAKTASVVEYNSADYVSYLHGVFKGDDEICKAISVWGEEEIQHGLALAKWAELADPSWNFERALARFKESYKVPVNVTASVRGSRSAELVARCIVEVGTTTFYSSLRDAGDEPVLKQIAHMIAVDEVHHFNLFNRALPKYLELDPLTKWERAKIAFSRAIEAEDEELLYAYAATCEAGDIKAENVPHYLHEYMGRTMPIYSHKNFVKGMAMAVRTIGVQHWKWLPGLISSIVIGVFRIKGRRYNKARRLAARPQPHGVVFGGLQTGSH